MWVLKLNPMTGNYEYLDPVAKAETREELEAFLVRETVEVYSDDDGTNMCGGKLRKSYRKGGPLEFYNPPDRPECFMELISLDEFLSQKTQQYHKFFNSIPSIHELLKRA